MTAFVESAILRIEDQSSAQLAKISANLRKFAATARSMQSQIGRVAAAQKQLSAGAGTAAFMGNAAALKRQTVAMRAATPAIDRLGTAYASAATKGQRFLTISGQITKAITAQAAAASAAKAAGVGGRGGAGGSGVLLPAGGKPKQRKGMHVRPHTSLHAAGVGVGIGIGYGDMPLGKALAISAMAGVTIRAAHVVVEGMHAGSSAREQLRQSGNENVAGAAEAGKEFAKRFGSSTAAVTKEFAEVTSFAAHEPEVQKKLVELLEAQKALAVARGGTAKEVEDGSLRIFKALDLMGTLKPDANGKVDTGQVEKHFQAWNAVQAVEGKNLRPEDFRQMMAQFGGHAQTISVEGLQRAALAAADVGGSKVGTQVAALDRAMSGVKGPGASKIAFANLKAEGFVKETDGRAHAGDESAYAKDPIGWIANHAAERMKLKGLDSSKGEDVKKYVDGLKVNTTVNRAMTSALNRQIESQRQIEATKHTRMSIKDAEGVAARSMKSAEDQFGNSLKNAGAKLEASQIGETYRKVLGATTRSVNSIVLDPSQNQKTIAAGVGALGVTVAAAIGKHMMDNPALSANTTAVGVLTGAVIANTAAQRASAAGGLLGTGGKAAGAGLLETVARVAGVGAAAAGAAYMTYKGLGGGESPEANAKTAEIVKLNEQIATLANVIEHRHSSGQDTAPQQAKLATAVEQLTKANEELVAIRNRVEAGAGDPSTPGSTAWLEKQAAAARRETERRGRERPPAQSGPDLKATIDRLDREIRMRIESIPGAGESEKKAVLGDLPQQLAKAQADFQSVGGRVQAAAQEFNGTVAKFESAGRTFEISMSAGAQKVEASGAKAGAAIKADAASAGAAYGRAASAEIRSATANITVNAVTKAAPNTGATNVRSQ